MRLVRGIQRDGDAMVSIKEVAQAAGVSTATVSRVLAGGPHVRPAVRERVQAAVARLDYRPNLVARSLRAQQSNTIGLIVSDIRNPFFTAISRAVEDTAYAHGMVVTLCNTDEDPQKEAIYLNLMRDTHVAGVILSPTRQTSDTIAALRLGHRSMPVVAIDRPLPHTEADLDIDTVLLDNADAAYQLTAHLLENGYQRIGAIVGEVSATGQERQRGYEEALRAAHLAPAIEMVRRVAPRMEAGYAAAQELLALTPRLDALVAGNSLLAAGAWRALRERRLTIPDDVALVSFDESTWEELVDPPITLIAQPTYEIGKTAAELLLRRMADPLRPAQQVTLKGILRVRASSARRHSETQDRLLQSSTQAT